MADSLKLNAQWRWDFIFRRGVAVIMVVIMVVMVVGELGCWFDMGEEEQCKNQKAVEGGGGWRGRALHGLRLERERERWVTNEGGRKQREKVEGEGDSSEFIYIKARDWLSYLKVLAMWNIYIRVNVAMSPWKTNPQLLVQVCIRNSASFGQ